MKKLIIGVLFAIVVLLLASCSTPQRTCTGQKRGKNPASSAQGVYLIELLDQFGSLSGDMILLQWEYNHSPHGAIAVCPLGNGFYTISDNHELPCGVAIIHRQIELPYEPR